MYGETVWAGEGAWRWGGRWNPPRTRVVYTSGSLALAALEFFVHLEPNFAPDDLQAYAVELPDGVRTERLAVARLPPGWDRAAKAATRSLGGAWARAGKSVGLWVPSAVVPGDWNLLINPVHGDFRRLRRLRPVPFRFDPRMFTR